MAWIQDIFGTELPQGVQLALLFGILIIALLLVFWLFRKIFNGPGSRFKKTRQPRLSVTDAAVVDDKRRLVLVRRDNVEHLVMIGGPSDIVVEQNIVRAAPVTVPQTTTPSDNPASVIPPVGKTPAQQTPPAIRKEPEPVETPAVAANTKSNTAETNGAATVIAGAGLAAVASETVSSTSSTVSDAASTASEKLNDASSTAIETVGESVAETASGVSSSLTGLADTAKSNMSEVTSELTANIDGALSEEMPDKAETAPTPSVSVDEPTRTENEMAALLKEITEEKQ